MKVRVRFSRHPYLYMALLCFGVTAGVLLLIMALLAYAPFGNKSIAVSDAHIQYLDFFSYLQRVLSGTESLIFTFTKGLGGSAVTLFAYYLASPLNVLVSFFQSIDLNVFLNLLFVLKAALASATLVIFLVCRFRDALTSQDRPHFKYIVIALLAISYGLSQYVLAQSSNIMWLDGVYMLPLMMLGVSKLVYCGTGVFLSVAAGLSIIFNWYTGGINCLFIIIWFIVELLLWLCSQPQMQNQLKLQQSLRRLGSFIGHMALAVMISGILFIPTVFAVLSSQHGSLQISELLNFDFVGQLPSTIEYYSLGANSVRGAVALYCGSLPIIAIALLLSPKRLATRQKLILSGFLLLLILACYWQPLIILFSLFEFVGSYWYRYSYIITAAMLFMAAFYFCQIASPVDYRRVLKIGFIIASIMMAVHFCRASQNTTLVYLTITLLLLMAAMLQLLPHHPKIGIVAIAALVLVELGGEAFLTIRRFREVDVAESSIYTKEMRSILNQLKSQDSSLYRISQIAPRDIDEYRTTASFNEPLAYGYLTTASYTSLPRDNQIQLLENLGYRNVYNLQNIITTSIIGSDSLLGVKYIISDLPIAGLEKTGIGSTEIGRGVYQNPFALPLAFTYQDNDFEIKNTDNPFEYQNEFYSKLLGREIELYHPLKFTLEQLGNVATKQSQKYTISLPKGESVIYGNIPASDLNPDMLMRVNNTYTTIYAQDIEADGVSLSPSVFYIPVEANAKQATIELISEQSYNIENGKEQFYTLDLELLATVTEEIIEASDQVELSLDADNIKASVAQAGNGQMLYLAIAADEGWTILRNGEKITPGLIGDTLYSIPLVEGDNVIEMHYRVPGLTLGIGISAFGVFVTVGIFFVQRHQKKKSQTVTKA